MAGNSPALGADTNAPELPTQLSEDAHIEGIQNELRKIERRDWWLWALTIVVILLLTGALVTFTFPDLLKVQDPDFRFNLGQATRGLIGLVLLFNIYTIYQQMTIKRLRRQFAEELEAMLDLRMRAQEFQRLATIDPLTGLANRRSAKQRLEAEAAHSQRRGTPLAVVTFDLNNFKRINDEYGHAAGDFVLREFAQKLTRTIRLSDMAVRMGGDEFLAVLPECNIEQVPSLLARLRPLEVEFQGARIPVDFSSGSVGYEQGETPEQFLERADQILYAEKRAGKLREAQPAFQ